MTVTIVALVATVFVSATPTSSAPTPTLSLTRVNETAPFEGQFVSAGVVASMPESCATTPCDEIDLDLDLRARDWNPDGGLQVGLRWTDEEQDLDLYVYGPDGRLAAKSDGFYASTAESVLIPAPINGRCVYRSDGSWFERTAGRVRICGDAADVGGEGTSCP